MAIYRLLKFSAFQPDEITCMTAAYEDALRVLQLADRPDPLTGWLLRKSLRQRNSANVIPSGYAIKP